MLIERARSLSVLRAVASSFLTFMPSEESTIISFSFDTSALRSEALAVDFSEYLTR